jgi:hypothetical protein
MATPNRHYQYNGCNGKRLLSERVKKLLIFLVSHLKITFDFSTKPTKPQKVQHKIKIKDKRKRTDN